MLISTLALLAAEAASPLLTLPVVLDGDCRYSPKVVERSGDAVLTDCNRATLSNVSGGTMFEFGRRSWDPAIRLQGALDGNRLTVSQIALPRKPFTGATGTCELFYAEGKLVRIGCLAKTRQRYYVTNFVVSRIETLPQAILE